MPAAEVVRLAERSRCTGYDAETGVLAHDLGVKLVTLDQQLLGAFPEVAVALDTYRPAPADRADPSNP